MRKNFLDKLKDEDTNPLSEMANLFDIAMVFAVALMVAMVSFLQMPEFLSQERMTIIKNPGQEDMEIIIRDGKEITRFKASEIVHGGDGRGQRIGVAYKLEDGTVIYVPD
jgi:hypothetical protein